MKYIITLLSICICTIVMSQSRLTNTTFKKAISKGVTVVQFNAKFNKDNGLRNLNDLNQCHWHTVFIDLSPELKKKYKIYAVPTIIVFYNGYIEKKFKGNIMLELDVTISDIQAVIDELLLNKF